MQDTYCMRYIYKISNLTNGKVYVGQTYDFAQRKAGHIYSSKNHSDERPLYRSMRKHGIENFSFEIIEECTDDLIDDREKFWISHFDSIDLDKGYNLEPGGKGWSDENRRTLSEALKGNTHCVGRVASQETRDKLRKCGRITTERRFGTKENVSEDRTCHCGNTFTVTYSVNRKYHVRDTCSDECSHVRKQSVETRSKISAKLRYVAPKFLIESIRNGVPLVKLATEFEVSYSTLKKLKRKIESGTCA